MSIAARRHANRVAGNKVYLAIDNDNDIVAPDTGNTIPSQTIEASGPISAHTGAYGSKPFAPHASMAELILKDLKTAWPDEIVFTREDLLQLRPVQGVSTISRYGEICQCVNYLVSAGKVFRVSLTEFCLPRMKKQIPEKPLSQIHYETIKSVVCKFGTRFSVMDVVDEWAIDGLTVNSKRVAVRTVLRRMKNAEEVKAVNAFEFTNVRGK